MIFVTVTEVQKDFDKYLEMLDRVGVITITENEVEVARLVPVESKISDSLVGVISFDVDEKEARPERYNNADFGIKY